MTLHARLEQIAAALPPSGSVTMTRADLLELLELDGDAAATDAGDDLTVAQVADRFGRGESTVRTWLGAGRFPNAYRLLGREWRVPPADVLAFQRAESDRFRSTDTRPTRSTRGADTGAWRQHLNPPSSR